MFLPLNIDLGLISSMISTKKHKKERSKQLVANLPSGVSVSPRHIGDKVTGYRLRLGARFTGGEVQRLTLPDLDAVRKKIEEEKTKKKKLGAAGSLLTPNQYAEALNAHQRATDLGLSLTELVDLGVKYYRPSEKNKTWKEVVDELLEEKKHVDKLADRSLRAYRFAFTKFGKQFGRRQMQTISAAEIEKFVNKQSKNKTTRRNWFRDLRVVFCYCLHPSRQYVTADPISQIILPDRENIGDVVVFSPAQVEACLKVAVQPEWKVFLPFVVINFFAPVRVAELLRLRWSDMYFETAKISIGRDKAKTRGNRLIAIRKPLATWLASYRNCDKTKKICPFTDRLITPLYSAMATAAGVEEWPKNVMRHTAISYLMAELGDENKVALEAGNSPKMIYQHYRNPMAELSKEEYFSLTPEKICGEEEISKIIKLPTGMPAA
jgi:integrase